MKLSRFYIRTLSTALSTFLIVVMISAPAFANGICFNVFTEEAGGVISQDPLSVLEILERRVTALNLELSNGFGHSLDLNESITGHMMGLQQLQLQLVGLQDRALQDEVILKAEVDSLVGEFVAILRIIRAQAPEPSVESLPEVTPSDFENLLESPGGVVADHIYEIETSDGKGISIRFSQRIVDEVFNNKSPGIMRALNRALRNLTKGLFTGHYEGAGLKRLIGDSNLVELRTIGSDASFRLYGYIHEGVVFIEAWTNSSDHSSISRYLQPVYRARLARGH